MPIEYCKKPKNKIIVKYSSDKKKILSSAIINRNFDVDISAFAIGFYKCIYKGILDDIDLVDENKIYNYQFTGDTMNSFNTTVNKLPKNAMQKKEISEIISNFKEKYHSLANLWILPEKIGREMSCILCKDNYCNDVEDYMDRYLEFLKNNENEIFKNYNFNKCFCFKEYFSKFENFNDFIKKHYLDLYIKNGNIVKFSNNVFDKNDEAIITCIKAMIKNIENRADIIAKNCTEELYNYFISILKE